MSNDINLKSNFPNIFLVYDFIKIKRDLTRVTGANISIRLTDDFMHAVQGGEEFLPCGDPSCLE